jgi:hypothetical protein
VHGVLDMSVLYVLVLDVYNPVGEVSPRCLKESDFTDKHMETSS